MSCDEWAAERGNFTRACPQECSGEGRESVMSSQPAGVRRSVRRNAERSDRAERRRRDM